MGIIQRAGREEESGGSGRYRRKLPKIMAEGAESKTAIATDGGAEERNLVLVRDGI